MQVSQLWTYPVKSCRGTAVEQARVEPWGLAGDRRWMLVSADDPAGTCVTARQVNGLLLVDAAETTAGVRVAAAGASPLDVARPTGGTPIPVSVFGDSFTATPADPAADAWFTAVTGRAVRLVWLDDPARRPTDPTWSDPGDRVSLADGYPLLLTSQASLDALGDAVVEGSQGAEEPVGMRRFRPNLVVAGAAAWAEDDWRRIRVGGPDGVVLRAVKACARCVMTTVDPDTAERGPEPVRTLARVRRAGGSTWFGVNLVPDVRPTGGTGSDGWPVVRVGDAVEVLDAVEAGGGPLREPS